MRSSPEVVREITSVSRSASSRVSRHFSSFSSLSSSFFKAFRVRPSLISATCALKLYRVYFRPAGDERVSRNSNAVTLSSFSRSAPKALLIRAKPRGRFSRICHPALSSPALPAAAMKIAAVILAVRKRRRNVEPTSSAMNGRIGGRKWRNQWPVIGIFYSKRSISEV